jgi:hypothetical protein
MIAVGIAMLRPRAAEGDPSVSITPAIAVRLVTIGVLVGAFSGFFGIGGGFLIVRRFRADVKYWLMDAKYYERGELSVGNPPLVDLVRKLGSKNLPETEPTTLSAMAYDIARGVLEQYPIMQRIEVHLIHFSRGLESKDEAEDNHVVNLVLQR